LHKHHLIIPIGAGLIQFVYDLRSRLANSGYPSEKSISAIFRASLYQVCTEKRLRIIGPWKNTQSFHDPLNIFTFVETVCVFKIMYDTWAT